jgi:hypothetical protein
LIQKAEFLSVSQKKPRNELPQGKKPRKLHGKPMPAHIRCGKATPA